jgi:hypothetical protein
MCHGFEATDDRDRIYALFGLANEFDRRILAPRYEKSVTTKEVYYKVSGSLLIVTMRPFISWLFAGTRLSPESTKGGSSWAS